MLTLLAPTALVAQQTVQPSPAIARSVPTAPDPRHVFVLDSAHLLSEAGIAALQDSALGLQRATGADVAFVTLPTLHGGSVEEAALTIGRLWGIGSNGTLSDATRDRGVVMLYVPDKAGVAGANLRVEVGRGLEGAITDGGGSRRILEAMKPGLRAKRYDQGFLAAFVTTAALVRAENAAQPRAVARTNAPTREESDMEHPLALFVVLALCVIAFSVLILSIASRVRAANLTLPIDESPGTGRSSSGGTSSFWSSSSSDSSSGSSGSSSDSGGSYGGGGGFSGGGSSDSV